MFSELFGLGKSNYKSKIKVDLHSHLIPGIDDGVKTIEDSIAILKKFEELGFKKIITTPHIMGDFYKNTPEGIQAGLQKVKEAAQRENIDIKIEAAAEYYLDEFFVMNLKSDKELLTLDGKHLLFELPYINPPIHMDETLFILQSKGYIPVLAHPERYQFYHGHLDKIRVLKEKGIKMQININSLIGYYSKPVEKMAVKMIKNNLVDFIGSDVHNYRHVELLSKSLTGNRAKQLDEIGLKNNTLL